MLQDAITLWRKINKISPDARAYSYKNMNIMHTDPSHPDLNIYCRVEAPFTLPYSFFIGALHDRNHALLLFWLYRAGAIDRNTTSWCPALMPIADFRPLRARPELDFATIYFNLLALHHPHPDVPVTPPDPLPYNLLP